MSICSVAYRSRRRCLWLVLFVGWIAATRAEAATALKSSSSGVVIGAHEILTNAHVVKTCTNITARSSSIFSAAYVIARDEENDLAVVHSNNSLAAAVSFRDGAVRPGDLVVALGYPLPQVLATTVNLTSGNVSALAGLNDDSRYLQISAPVQLGNSGGPLLDTSGHLIGIVTAKLNALDAARVTGDIPQNVNFALKADVARTFLDSKGIAYLTARSEQQLSAADVGDIARPVTVKIECYGPQDESQGRTAAAATTAATASCEYPTNVGITAGVLYWLPSRE